MHCFTVSISCPLFIAFSVLSFSVSCVSCFLPLPQQASYAASSFSSVSYCVQQPKVPFSPEDCGATQGLTMSVSNSFLSRHSSFPVHSYKSVFRSYSQDFVPHNQVSIPPFLSSTSSSCSTPPFPPVHLSQSPDLAVPAAASQSPSTVDVPNSSSQESSFNGNAPVCLPSETSFTDSLQTPSESPPVKDGHSKDSAVNSSAMGKEGKDGAERQPQSPDALESSQLEEEVDELSLIDHSEIMSRLTLKQEVGAFRVCFHTLLVYSELKSDSLCAQTRHQLLLDRKN